MYHPLPNGSSRLNPSSKTLLSSHSNPDNLLQNQSQIMHSSMDSNPPSHQSEPCLARIDDFSYEAEELPHLSLDLVPYSPKKTSSPQISDSIPLQELLLSPLPARRSKSRTVERIEMDEEPVDPIGSRRRCKSRAASMGLLGCASPRNGLRARRRLEQENREEKDVAVIEEKARKRRQSNRSRKEKLSLVPSVPSSSSSPKTNDDDQSNLDRIGKLIFDLIMWNDVAKSSFWFGFGSLCFLSSCFGGGLSFSLFSTVSQLGLFILGVSSLFNSFSQRDKEDKKEVNLKEEDIVGAFRVMLPAANLVIVKTRKFFSGEPSMTLKVAPFLLFGAKYGHLITLWRVFATGFFISFTTPKLYSCYSTQINKQVEYLRCWVWETWGACSQKKIVVVLAATAFWNLSTLKTRIFAAFISMVILRYYQQHSAANAEEEEGEQSQSAAACLGGGSIPDIKN